jgi:hypothetical protein
MPDPKRWGTNQTVKELGSQYVIGLKVVNRYTGDLLAEAQEQAAGKEAALKVLDAAAVRLRSKLGESLSTAIASSMLAWRAGNSLLCLVKIAILRRAVPRPRGRLHVTGETDTW